MLFMYRLRAPAPGPYAITCSPITITFSCGGAEQILISSLLGGQEFVGLPDTGSNKVFGVMCQNSSNQKLKDVSGWFDSSLTFAKSAFNQSQKSIDKVSYAECSYAECIFQQHAELERLHIDQPKSC